MDIAFYLVDNEYIQFLKQYELKNRGFTCVPNVHYNSREKFFYGAILQNNGINYFVPVSHNVKSDINTIVITGKKKNTSDKPYKYGSLKFMYMIPVPSQMLYKLDIPGIEDLQRRRKVLDELAFCRRNIAKIQETARKTYDGITISENKKILNNSCDFKLLEQAYVKFCHENELPIPVVQNKEQDTALLSKLITVLHESDEILRQNPELKEKYLKAEISYKKGALNSQTSETIAVQLKIAQTKYNERCNVLQSDSSLKAEYIAARNKFRDNNNKTHDTPNISTSSKIDQNKPTPKPKIKGR